MVDSAPGYLPYIPATFNDTVDCVVLSPDDSIARAMQLMSEQGVSGFPVTERGERKGKVVGILTRRDMKFLERADGRTVGQVMTLMPAMVRHRS